MAVTVTTTLLTKKAFFIAPAVNGLIGTFTTTGTYVTGGIAFDMSAYLRNPYVVLVQPDTGYNFAYDDANNKLKVFTPTGSGTTSAGSSHNHVLTGTAQAPLLVTEEVLTVSSNTGTLAYAPFYIVAVHVTAGSTTGAFNVIPTGETPLTKQVAVTTTTGVCTFLSTDAVTSAKVTYIPQRTGGPFAVGNMVVDETGSAAAAKLTLANRAGAVQYVWNDTNNVLCALEPVGEAPSATNTAVVDITDSTDTKIDFNATDENDDVKISYIKHSSFAQTGLWRDDTDLTLSSEAYNWTNNGFRALAVPGLGTQVVGEMASAVNSVATWEGPSGTAADTVATWDPVQNYLLTNNTSAIATLAMPFFYIDPLTHPPQTPAGTNAAEAAHTHTITAETGDELANGATLTLSTAVPFLVLGRR